MYSSPRSASLVGRVSPEVTRYGRCPGCGAKTKSAVTTTLRSASYTSEGLVRVDERCENGAYASSYTRTTPRRERSSSSSSSSRCSGFGGGSSAGRGASGSW